MALRGAPLRPSTVSITRVCVDAFEQGELFGTVVNPYMPEPVAFAGVFALLEALEHTMDTLNFPQAYESLRTFGKEAPRARKNEERSLTRYMEEKTFETKVGKQATFIVQIQFRQNATWQGTITWSEKKKVQHFRSTLEMIKLMDDAIEQARQEDETFASWDGD